jgi:hypothetical protein
MLAMETHTGEREMTHRILTHKKIIITTTDTIANSPRVATARQRELYDQGCLRNASSLTGILL